MHAMLSRAMSRRTGAVIETMHSDSLYAINMTTGKWMPRKHINDVMIRELRSMWRRLQRQRPGEVKLRHLRSHIGIRAYRATRRPITSSRYAVGNATGNTDGADGGTEMADTAV